MNESVTRSDPQHRDGLKSLPRHHPQPLCHEGSRAAPRSGQKIWKPKPASIKQHISDMCADLHKFFVSLGKLRSCNLTGVGDKVVLSMAVTVPLEPPGGLRLLSTPKSWNTTIRTYRRLKGSATRLGKYFIIIQSGLAHRLQLALLLRLKKRSRR